MGRRANFRRALVVEDEIMVAMYVEDLLTELGFEVAATATDLEPGPKRVEWPGLGCFQGVAEA
jgi:CheY-like chemotaxis protein